jgi:hypothetical protein
LENGLCLLASFLLLSAPVLDRFVQVLGRLDEDRVRLDENLFLSASCLREFNEDRFHLGKVLVLSVQDGGEEDEDLVFLAECLGRLAMVLGGPEKALGRLEVNPVRLDEALSLSTE